MRKLFSGAVLVALILALGAVICSAIWTRALIRARSGDEIVRVIGSARKSIHSDFIIWNGSISETAPTVPQRLCSNTANWATSVGQGVRHAAQG